jgi:DNA transformation protein
MTELFGVAETRGIVSPMSDLSPLTRVPNNPCMSRNSDFADEVIERLARVVSSYRARRMFGGVGLYSGEHFFGIVAFDRLWFKVDDGNRGDYQARGKEAFQPFSDRPTKMSNFEVPPDLLDDSEELRVWAMRSVAIARRAKQKSPRTQSCTKSSAR